MNYYERIQQSLDYMEDNLENEISVEDIAKEAYMSVSNFYRMFFALIGFQVKEYLIKRRISMAACDLKNSDNRIIDVAIKYAYESPDAFTRTFKKVTGYTPRTYAKGNYKYQFERINVMEEYFDNNDRQMMEQYPEVKVISKLPDMRVAYYCYYGRSPEDGAFSVMSKWMMDNKNALEKAGYRIFGYNAPDTQPDSDEYGYEVCVTIPQDMKIDDELVKSKVIQGGTYAVVSIESHDNLGENIMSGWQRFTKWLEVSKYVYGETQWLEEHLGFDSNMEHIGGVDLYMPIKLKSQVEEELNKLDCSLESIPQFTTASYVANGKNAESNAREYLFKWIKDNNICLKNSWIFANYNFEKIGRPDYFYRLYISIPDDMVINDTSITKEIFPGGAYLTRRVKYRSNGQSWYNFISSIESSNDYTFGSQPFMEEYILEEPVIDLDTDIVQHMPVSKK